MGFLDRFTKAPPPTVTNSVEDAASDPEKAPIPTEQEDVSSPVPARHRVSPEVEKRVVRKLDFRFTSLVGFLCTLAFDSLRTDRATDSS